MYVSRIGLETESNRYEILLWVIVCEWSTWQEMTTSICRAIIVIIIYWSNSGQKTMATNDESNKYVYRDCMKHEFHSTNFYYQWMNEWTIDGFINTICFNSLTFMHFISFGIEYWIPMADRQYLIQLFPYSFSHSANIIQFTIAMNDAVNFIGVIL